MSNNVRVFAANSYVNYCHVAKYDADVLEDKQVYWSERVLPNNTKKTQAAKQQSTK